MSVFATMSCANSTLAKAIRRNVPASRGHAFWLRQFCAGILSLLTASSLSVSVASAQVTSEAVPGEIIVKLKGSGKSLKSQAFLGKAVSEGGLAHKGSWTGLNMHHFKVNDSRPVDAVIEQMQADPDVEYVEPNYILRRPDDTEDGEAVSIAEVRAVANSSSSVASSSFTQSNAPVQFPQAWEAASATGATIVVAVVDTGVDYNHSVFADSGAMWVNSRELPNNGVDDDGNGFVDDVRGWNFAYNSNNPMDDDGHGTHVAGIVLGATQNISAYPMSLARIRIMPLKFLDSNGMGTTSDAVKAIYYAVNNGAKVINNSWGGGGYSNALVEALNYAYNNKVVLVAAAGNSSNNNDQSPTYPASYPIPGLISVAATTDFDNLASFSNYGANTVHVGAPGSGIYSTYPYNSYGRSSGTSMATPFVAGLSALILRENPNLTAFQVRELVFSGAVPIASLASKTTTKSRMNAYNSVQAAKSAIASSSQPNSQASAQRAPAAEAQAVGCGLVKAMRSDFSGPGSGDGMKQLTFFGVLMLMMAPVLIALRMRRQAAATYRRRFPRYQIASEVKLCVGDRELVGSLSTISMGGAQVNTDAWLDNGGVVAMVIKSPDGREEITVSGKVVWSEEKKRYGVAFQDADTSSLNSIARWTKSLMRAS
jgi:subtilisin family serine protease